MEHYPLIPGADPEPLGCFGRRETLNAAQGDDLGVPGGKANNSGEDRAHCLIAND